MHPAAGDTDASFREALAEAARRLPAESGYAHLFHEAREDLRLVLVDGRVEECVHTRSRGLACRAGLRRVFQSDPVPEDARRLVKAVTGSRPPAAGGRSEPEHAPQGTRLDAGRPRALLERLTAEVLRSCSESDVSVRARWVAFRQVVEIARPDRPPCADLRRSSRVRLEVQIGAGGRRSLAVGEAVIDPQDEGSSASLATRTAARARERLDARPAASGERPVVFAAGVGGILIHEIVGHALEADTVLRRASWLAGRSGPCAAPGVIVVDDPRRGRGAWSFDDEGEPARATSLVHDGRVRGWLHDLRSSALAGVAPTGHGRLASYVEPVRPRMGCTFLASGPLRAGEVLEGCEHGVLVRRMEAASVDPATGVALFRVTDADAIHRGRIDAPLDPFLLEIASRSALDGMDRVADDLAFDACIGSCVRDGQPLPTSVGAPTCRIGVATVLA